MKKQLLLLLALMCLLGCKSTTYTASDLPDEQLAFGSGGGFAGTTITYILLKNGQLFKQESRTKDTQEIASVKAKTAKAMYNRSIELGLDTLQIKEPGNLYYFMHLKTDEADNQISWGSGDYELPVELESLYKDLQQLTKATK